MKLGLGLVIVLILAGLAVMLMNNGKPAYNNGYNSGSYTNAPVLLTDPAQVPTGTSALLVTYSSLQVHSEGASGSGWVSATGNGTIDLLSVQNSSQLIGFANLSTNSTINLARLTVTSAKITINGTTYNVTLPNSQVTIAVTGQTKINPSAGVLLDLAPVVTAIYTKNTTTFMMAPSARATVVSSTSVSADAQVGARVGLSASESADLQESSQNISITAASVAVSGNTTTLSVTVKDNSNASATLNELLLFGNESATVTAVAGVNASVSGDINGALDGVSGEHGHIGGNAMGVEDVGINIEAMHMVAFSVSAGGSLALPSAEADFEGSGYTLNAGNSTTLTFSGTMSYGNGAFIAKLVAGAQYKVTVVGESDAMATTTVTAT